MATTRRDRTAKSQDLHCGEIYLDPTVGLKFSDVMQLVAVAIPTHK